MPIRIQEAGARFQRFLSGPSSHPITEALFLRALGVIYLLAFGALLPQLTGLIGSHGIVPAALALSSLRADLGSYTAFLSAPSIFWLRISDPLLLFACGAGGVASLFMILFRSGARVAAFLCWILYLSLVSVGSPFLTFQWDALLLEAGFLALFAGAPWLIWCYRFLLFRLMFQSGAIKFLSGDLNWENLHALRYHFLTQPLPNAIAYYAYRLPNAVLDFLTALALGIELVAPLLLFAPRVFRLSGVTLLAALQLGILSTGNYAFFNFLSLALCLWGLDDRALMRFRSLARSGKGWHLFGSSQLAVWRSIGNLAMAVMIALGLAQVLMMFRVNPGRSLRSLLEVAAPFQVVNGYGLFAVMTTARPELVIEGSNDQLQWLEYSFPYKPGELHRSLPVIAPYQPRLDWQMWFAALGSYTENSWVGSLMYRILVGDPAVLQLMGKRPFTKPPRYLRAVLYDYQFTTPEERATTGAIWKRTLKAGWFGPVSLTGR